MQPTSADVSDDTPVADLAPRDRSGDAAVDDVDPRVERTIAAIIESSFDLLVAEGPDAITHARVAADARMSRTTVYAHFPTRSDLLRATIEAYAKPLPLDLTGDLRTDLIALVEDLVTDLADDERSRAIAAIMERALHDDVVRQVRDDMVCEADDMFRQAIRNGVRRGEIDPAIDVELALASLVGAFLFRRFLLGSPYGADDVERIIDDFLRVHAPR
jgi:AcrR family transcriptional regulator